MTNPNVDPLMITDLAEALRKQYDYINEIPNKKRRKHYETQLRDDTISVVSVLHKHIPEFNTDAFYILAGYEGIHPVH